MVLLNNRYKHILLIPLIAILLPFNASAQAAKKQTARIQLEYFKDHNGGERVVATLKVRSDRYRTHADALIHFYTVNDTSRVLLDKITTDANGEAIYVMEDEQKIHKDSSGLMTFEVEYSGNASIKSAHKSIQVKQVKLKTSFFQEDDLKYISIDVNEIEPDNSNTPIEGHEVFIYIKGTFSLLNIGKETTDEEGKIKIEFPIDMPGDTIGTLTIVTQIEDSDMYGNVESRSDMNWGIPVPLKAEQHRGLGDTDAPLWMVYTLITLLSIVWFTYMYVIVLIIKIRRAKNEHVVPAVS